MSEEGMAKRVGVDKWLFGRAVLLLVLFGLVMVFSASAVMAKATVGNPVLVCGQAGSLGRAWYLRVVLADAH